MTRLHRLVFCALFSGLALCATTARAALLSTLIDTNGSIQVGDKLFSDFSYSKSGSMPAPTAVNVTAYTDLQGNFGIQIQGSFVNSTIGGSSTALLDYTVTVLNANYQIVGATLAGNPAVLAGGGTSSVTTSFLPEENTTLTVFSTVPGAQLLATSGAFAQGHQTLHVQNTILGSSTTGVETLSFVRQTFVQVPEPATLALFSLGAGAVILIGRCRRRA